MQELVRRHFVRQAETCDNMDSPFTARLLRLCAERLDGSTPFSAAIMAWPEDRLRYDALALRVAGALHALVLSGRDRGLATVYPPHEAPAGDDALWSVVGAAIRGHQEFLTEFLGHPPQTNETARAAVLLVGFHEVAQLTGKPLALYEIGASAGLNQHWDRFHYTLGDTAWGPADASVRLTPEWRGRSPELAPIDVDSCRACDRNPLDVSDPAQALRLRAFIWPDQLERLKRLDAAIAIAREHGVRLARADAEDWTAASLMQLRPGVATVIYHSIFWQYLTTETQRTLRSTIEVAGAGASEEAPLAWVRMEPDEDEPYRRAALYVTLWPEGDRRVLAFSDYHARWIEPLDA